MMTKGGKTVYGASVGILMLETRFPRILGDVGNALTWPFPVQYKVVPKAAAKRAVGGDVEALIPDFIAAGRELIDMGCDGITTSCGFLALIQDEIQEGLGVPVATSSLMQIPMIQAVLPKGKHVGVITISKESLSPAHLVAAGAPPDTPIIGTENGRCFTQAILDDATEMDFTAARLDMLDAAEALVNANPTLGAIVLECTNMVPYAADIRALTGLPVYTIYSFVTWFQAGLVPRVF